MIVNVDEYHGVTLEAKINHGHVTLGYDNLGEWFPLYGDKKELAQGLRELADVLDNS